MLIFFYLHLAIHLVKLFMIIIWQWCVMGLLFSTLYNNSTKHKLEQELES